MPFMVNGTNMNIAPQGQKYIDIITGTDHTGRPIFASVKHVELTFDQMSVSLYNQFSALNGTSLNSIQLLSIDQAASYVTYTSPNLNFMIKERPTLQAGVVSGWTALIMSVTPA